MELFYAYKLDGRYAYLDTEESSHCVRVLRHRAGDKLNVIDGRGTLLHCTLSEPSATSAVASIDSEEPGWGGHPYYLRMAVCPTKNIDRYEWFLEKAVELGVDEVVPVIGEHSERRNVRVDRLRKISLSAAKQSLKGAVPSVAEPMTVLDFVGASQDGLRLIAYCSDDVAPRGSIVDALKAAFPAAETPSHAAAEVTVLIGPEGDFSQDEVRSALDAGFIPVHLGPSRLRTETAAITAVEAAYFTLGLDTPAYDKTPPQPLEDNHL